MAFNERSLAFSFASTRAVAKAGSLKHHIRTVSGFLPFCSIALCTDIPSETSAKTLALASAAIAVRGLLVF